MFVRQSDILKERRGPMRVAVRQRVWCTFNGKTMRCESHDLSATGVKLGAPRYLPVGTRVELKPDHASPLVGRRRVCAQVVWSRPEHPDEACLGLEFCEPAPFDGSWAASALNAAIRRGAPTARRSRRHAAQLKVVLVDADRQLLGRGVSVDLSQGGLCMLTDARLEPGQALLAQIYLPYRSQPLELPCRTVSSVEDRLHLRFFTMTPAQQRDLGRYLQGRNGLLGRLLSKLFA